MYSTQWCGYCHRLKSQLDREGIAYDVVDIERVPDAAFIVEQVNGGNQTVPTLVYADGTAQTNPSRGAGQGEARRARLSAAHQDPGSGPPYHASTSDRLIEMPPGSTSVPGLGLGLHLLAGEPARVADLVAVDRGCRCDAARAKKPTIRLCGNGHGWLPK